MGVELLGKFYSRTKIILRKGKGFLERITALNNMYSYRKVKMEK